MLDGELDELKLFLQKAKDICSDTECEDCPFAYYDSKFTLNCAIDDPPTEWKLNNIGRR